MADSNLQGLVEDTTPASDSLVYMVDDPAGVPVDRKVTMANASKAINLDNVTSGTTNKVFTATEQTKLTGIETSATADQSNAEIKTAYEANADTNAFTDAEQTKLTGIETSADVTDTANVDSAGALMKSVATTKGDIFGATASATIARLDVGANDTVLTADSATATGLKWATPVGGGGNPYGATYVLATSGGDYTNLATALTAMVAGDILYVEPGTYSNSGFSTALNNITIIGKNAQTCIFENNNSSHNVFSGTDVRLQNIKMTNVVAGRWIFQGESLVIERCIHQGNDTQSLVVQGQYSRISNNEFSVTQPADDMIWQFSGNSMVVSNNTFYSANGSNASGSNKAVVVFASMSGTFTGNSVYAGGTTNEAPALGIEASDCSVTGNSIETTASGVGIFVQGSFASITGNNIDTCKVGIVVGNQNAVITGNAIRCASYTGQQGIRAGSYSVISGNHVFGQLSASSVGISVPATKDYVTIVGNMIYNFVTGVSVDASTSDDTVIMGNSIVGATTEISDTGTGTLYLTATDSDPLNR